jgi:Flp pilus assembly protein TadG
MAICNAVRLFANKTLLWRNRRGNSTMLLALSALPILAGVSVSVDYAMAQAAHGRLDQAAASAAKQATSAAADALLSGANDPLQAGVFAARARFTAQIAGQGSLEMNPLQVALDQSNGVFNATVSYSGSVATSFARVVGISSLPVSGQASASFSYSPPVDVQVLMDVSSSMTWAATPAERAKLERLIAGFKPTATLPVHAKKGEACGFACHWSNTEVDYYQLALSNHIPLRVTLLQDAVIGLLRTMSTLDAVGRFGIGLYSFDNAFHVVHPLSHDLRSVLQSVPKIANSSLQNAAQALATADAALPRGGDEAPHRFVFIVTDGVEDEANAGAAGIHALAPGACDGLKSLGFAVLVLHTPYPALPNSVLYTQAVAPVANRIAPALQACASAPSYVFEAKDGPEMVHQMQNMLRVALRSTTQPTN